MKKTNMLYWILTGLFAFVMLGSAVPDALMMPVAVNGFAEIGLPAYLLPFLGIAKILGVVAILIPGYPRLKEWAYAGLIFDLIGAVYCVANVKPVAEWALMPALIILGFSAYAMYRSRIKRSAVNKHINLQQHNITRNENAPVAALHN